MSNKLSRRGFLTAAGVAAAAPMILPSTAYGRTAPSKRINMGCIGIRSMGDANLSNFIKKDDCRIVALCDLDDNILAERTAKVNDYYGNRDCKTYTDYRELLDRRDIDAVMIATPDHWHAAIAIAAARAGKDIYCEKPITHTHAEGKMLVDEVNRLGRIWQTGSWQRSQFPWRRAVDVVRNGLLGEVTYAEVGLPSGNPYPPANGGFLVPKTIHYDRWCGPAPMLPYHPKRHHFNWRWNHHYGGGQMMDWMGHHNDILHWMLDEEHGGPVEVHTVDFRQPQEREVWDGAWKYEVLCTYASGVKTRITNRTRQGVTVYGTDGWLFISRGEFITSNPAWTNPEFNPGPFKAYESNDHWRNFLDSVKSRKRAVTTAEISHRSVTPGHLAMISAEVGAALKWDPAAEEIIGNEAATKLIKQQGDKAPWKPWRDDWCELYLTEPPSEGRKRSHRARKSRDPKRTSVRRP